MPSWKMNKKALVVTLVIDSVDQYRLLRNFLTPSRIRAKLVADVRQLIAMLVEEGKADVIPATSETLQRLCAKVSKGINHVPRKR
jgi:hypothetical protein